MTSIPATDRDPIGTAALVLGAIAVLAATLSNVVQIQLIPVVGVQAYGLIALVRGIVFGLLGIVALVLGLVGLLRPSTRKAAAAAGAAFGSVLVLETVSGLLISLLATLR